MSNLTNSAVSSDDFLNKVFIVSPKPIFFWDTCGLLDILRLPFRKGDLQALQCITAIKSLIDSDLIYSISSELTTKEWNDHFALTISETKDSLKKTSAYHNNCIEMINHLYSTTYVSDDLSNKGLVEAFELIADEILQKTVFISFDKISGDALRRVANKLPPSKKKPEFKDCAIWETVLDLSNLVRPFGLKFVYFTVNTEDYVDKARTPQLVHPSILTEAVTYGVSIGLTFREAYNSII